MRSRPAFATTRRRSSKSSRRSTPRCKRVGSRWPDTELLSEPILRPGSWIGGDRDGNPNVTAEVVRKATGDAAYTALGHYFTEITALEEELSMSARLVKVSDALVTLADQCHEPARADEPYRRALRVVHARLTATASEILDRQPPYELDLGLDRYDTPAELLADLDVVDESLRTNGSAVLADDRLSRLREAVHVFGFHLSGLDMRQNSDVHEEVVAELLAWAGVHPDYRSLPEPERVELLAAEVATRRPLVGAGAELSELDATSSTSSPRVRAPSGCSDPAMGAFQRPKLRGVFHRSRHKSDRAKALRRADHKRADTYLFCPLFE